MASKKEKLLERARSGGSLKFQDAVYLIEQYGFVLGRVKGSHHVFVRGKDDRLVLVKHGGSDVKPYVVRQMLTMID